jgi:adenine-specific DNA-methyltransferase
MNEKTKKTTDEISLDAYAKRREQLKLLFPEVFSSGELDLDMLNRVLGAERKTQAESFGINWLGKNASRQEATDQTNCTLVPDSSRSVGNHDAKNLLIIGENLDVLRVLQDTHAEQVKLIYIDPPYNTGSDGFVYPDQFAESKQAYQKRANAKSEAKTAENQDFWLNNVQDNGRFHSVWLSMMYPRLFLSRKLLREDGVLYISIDENEVTNLKMITDEIYGKEHFIGKFIWANRTTPNDAKLGFAADHEYILIYAKNIKSVSFLGIEKDMSNYKNPDNDPRGPWIADNPSAASGNENYKFPIINPNTGQAYTPPKGRYWAFAPRRVAEWTESGKLVFPKQKDKNFVLKKYKSELKSTRKPIGSLIQGILTSAGTKEMKALFGDASPFKYPKPTELLKKIFAQVTSGNDLILDFFAGSGSTAHAVMDLNEEDGQKRNWICVQMPEKYQSEDADLNAQYQYVSDVTEIRIKKVIEKIKATKPEKEIEDLGFQTLILHRR